MPTSPSPSRSWRVRYPNFTVTRTRRITYLYSMTFVCQLRQANGTWTAEHTGPNVGPVRVTAPTRDEALRKLETEIRYWLEMCPCSGQTYQHLRIQLAESG
jgi:hypothetical protein